MGKRLKLVHLLNTSDRQEISLAVSLTFTIDIRHGTGLETGLFPAICADHPRLAGKSRIKVRGQVECALF